MSYEVRRKMSQPGQTGSVWIILIVGVRLLRYP